MTETGPARRFRLLLVEDQEDVASTVERYLGAFEFDVAHAASGQAAQAAFAEARPDIVLLDLGLPDTDGTRLLSAFATEGRVPVIIVTGRDDEVDRVVGLELGAVDYVTKPFSLRELLARLRTHLRFARAVEGPEAGDPADSSTGADLRSLGPFTLDRAQREVRHRGRALPLTAAEFDLLALLAECEIVPRDTIARAILRKPLHPGDRSVDQLVHRLRSRLGATGDDWGMVESVRGVGYRLVVRSAD